MIYAENYFLIVLAFIWIAIAVIQDIRKREVANWVNFSLVAIALSYRAFVSVFLWDYWYFVYGLIGFGIFFALANLFYYSRIFAGGDAKLLIGLGPILPFSYLFYENLKIFFYFIVLLMFCGSIYGLLYSVILSYRHKKQFSKEFLKQLKKNKRIILVFIIPAVFLFVFSLIVEVSLFILLPLLVLIFPFLYIYAKAIEESCMVKKIAAMDLTEGDWLHEKVKVGRKTIKPNWQGVSAEDLKILRKLRKKVLIKQGIPFTPSFLFAFVILVLLRYSNWSFW